MSCPPFPCSLYLFTSLYISLHRVVLAVLAIPGWYWPDWPRHSNALSNLRIWCAALLVNAPCVGACQSGSNMVKGIGRPFLAWDRLIMISSFSQYIGANQSCLDVCHNSKTPDFRLRNLNMENKIASLSAWEVECIDGSWCQLEDTVQVHSAGHSPVSLSMLTVHRGQSPRSKEKEETAMKSNDCSACSWKNTHWLELSSMALAGSWYTTWHSKEWTVRGPRRRRCLIYSPVRAMQCNLWRFFAQVCWDGHSVARLLLWCTLDIFGYLGGRMKTGLTAVWSRQDGQKCHGRPAWVALSRFAGL